MYFIYFSNPSGILYVVSLTTGTSTRICPIELVLITHIDVDNSSICRICGTHAGGEGGQEIGEQGLNG